MSLSLMFDFVGVRETQAHTKRERQTQTRRERDVSLTLIFHVTLVFIDERRV